MIYFLLSLAILLQLLDWWSTTTILRAGGRELNPVLAKLFNRFGIQPALIAYKVLIAVGCVYLAYAEFVEILAGICVIYLLVVGNNIWQMRRH